MFILARAVTYATLFAGLVLILVPTRVLSWSGIRPPTVLGTWQVAGIIMGTAGAALALSCVVAFVSLGRGTPAPFDPPRRLVIQGPYRVVRNPMYVGAGLALAGAALFYQSFALLGYVGGLVLVTQTFVVAYEEPTLRRTFGDDYLAYCRRTGRWWPRV